jgi:hypothetical protein
MIEKEVLFHASAFHHVVPAVALTSPEAALYMSEFWRLAPVKRDLGHFACHHCRQYAKYKFCAEVKIVCHGLSDIVCSVLIPPFISTIFHYQCVTVLIAEGLMDTLPILFQDEGFESSVTNVQLTSKTNVHGQCLDLSTPEKTRQRFKSRS